jgi:hypothetical protein
VARKSATNNLISSKRTEPMTDEVLKPVEPIAAPAPEAAAEPPPPSPKERIQEIAAALTKASPSGVEALAGELASLAESL